MPTDAPIRPAPTIRTGPRRPMSDAGSVMTPSLMRRPSPENSRGMTRSEADLVEQETELVGRQLAHLSAAQVTQPDRADRRARQPQHRMANLRHQPPHDPVAPLVDDQ